jgi:hypothetical protein
MDYETAKNRLWNHANLPEHGLPIEESLVGSLWLAHNDRGALRFLCLTEDVLECLNTVNLAKNGPNPADRCGPSPNECVVLDVAYSVSGIISGCLDYHRRWTESHKFDAATLASFEVALHKIAFAWGQVLAGDVGDILEGFRDA